MLPAHIAQNIKNQILYYLQSTFSFRDKKTDRAFQRFIQDPRTGLFKGPWVMLKRPFRSAADDVVLPFDIRIPYHPFVHQYRAWMRLSSKNGTPEHTIITTGTGSGKTECFLYPVVDHCLRMKKAGQKGIKAIILYPMNALAADQEARFAKTIWNDTALKSAGIRVGNYTGRYDPSDPGAGKESGTKQMGENHGISNHEAQLDNPPDILLTNYRMLDFLLMRPQDSRLWRFNVDENIVLKYLVLDELHTYDGAQGADVACLIRRLKSRLNIEKGGICVVGTSATLDDQAIQRESDTEGEGSGFDKGAVDKTETGKDKLAGFAEILFEEKIDVDAVIGEDRLDVENIVRSELIEHNFPDAEDCSPLDGENSLSYVIRQSGLWEGPEYDKPDANQSKLSSQLNASSELKDLAIEKWELSLGEWLRHSVLFKYLLEIFLNAELANEDPVSWYDLVERLTHRDLELRKIESFQKRSVIIASFCSLVAHARELRNNMPFPLVPTQVQLWIRELRRLGRIVSHLPEFIWLDEPVPGVKSLPAFHCSECGESGWVAMHDPDQDSLINSREVTGYQMVASPTRIYRGWFGSRSNDKQINYKNQYIFTISLFDEDTDMQAEPEQMAISKKDSGKFYFCPQSLVIRKGDGPCPLTGDTRRFRVLINNENRKLENGKVVGIQGCPRCKSVESLFFIGSQAATLASVAIDEMFGSILNNDPKLLAFTDSVQDASHRAGFFTSRTYHFTFRTALQHVINAHMKEFDKGLSLPQVSEELFAYWSKDLSGRPGSIRETMTALMPPDLQEYGIFQEYRNHPGMNTPPKALFDEIKTRLNWQAISEFGLMQTHGRTMELNGSACLGWDDEVIDSCVGHLKEMMPGINPEFTKIKDKSLRIWIYGFLHRCRERGALDHPYLMAYARQNFWGKYPFGRIIKGRETFPPAIRYKPRLMLTAPQKGHEWVMAHTRGGQKPWHIVWSYRALDEPAVGETDVLDLIRALLTAGRKSGLFKRLHLDGQKEYYTISAQAALLLPGGVHLVCDRSKRSIVRPSSEADLWKNAPSMEYDAKKGRYRLEPFSRRQKYYQDRYNKGALRRVVAEEHTGLLGTEQRESVENNFKSARHADDPNVLTCTSTLEMGIDIGDLSTTMLCSIPPSTASYLQRIGRAGRSTGTALIVSIVNQRPHDLFFFARPLEMLKGKVEPPGCWLDASAVLARQYLGFCFDTSTTHGHLIKIPQSGGQLVDDMKNKDGHFPKMLEFITKNEAEMQQKFLARFKGPVHEDTIERFLKETETRIIIGRIYQAANEFERIQRDLANARTRLNSQLKSLDAEEKDAELEIKQELRIIRGRINNLNRTTALEILTDHGLLPNYAFPERGVRFYGAVYNRHQSRQQEHKPVEVYRSAASALRELAPGNVFYTHRRQFAIQQLAIGNPKEPLTETWAICGICGHMRTIETLNDPGAKSACPQCGHGGDQKSQIDKGQQKQFIEFPKSQALSYMEHYESLSGDRNEERQSKFYNIILSFDHTIDAPSGAVGEESLPFGIEYRASLILREINAGFSEDSRDIPFGPDATASESGFVICQHCGVVILNDDRYQNDHTIHRRSCHTRRTFEKKRQTGKITNPFKWHHAYIYRQLKSEAIRLLLPITDAKDIYTLAACIYLGLRLRFEGNPAHLIVSPQILPDTQLGLARHFLVIMDAVPGGTGFLKTLYQEKDQKRREGEGIIDVLRRARDTLETCDCRKLNYDKDDTDGCYRCIRTYHMQYKSDQISRERGIKLLDQLIEAGKKRVQLSSGELASIKPDSLFGSVLEKKFVDTLKEFVEQKKGNFSSTIIKGSEGFMFSLPDSEHIWELELQPSLGPAQGVMIQSQPDFLLICDDEAIKPVAIFTDGYEFHCCPNNRLADDVKKRRSIIDSDNFHVWNITWEDLATNTSDNFMICHEHVVKYVKACENSLKQVGRKIPDAHMILSNGMEQLKAFILSPFSSGWKDMSKFLIYQPLQILFSANRIVSLSDLEDGLKTWRTGKNMEKIDFSDTGDFIYNDRAGINQDLIAFISKENIVVNRMNQIHIYARIGDNDEEVCGSDFKKRWRSFLASINLYQFRDSFRFWTSSEVSDETAPEISVSEGITISAKWQEILTDVIPSLKQIVKILAVRDIPVPVVEYYNENINDDASAELAWDTTDPKIAVLAKDQEEFADQWQQLGWKVVMYEEIEVKGFDWFCGLVVDG
ncbi:DEAD/DEAH box helicase [Desulfobacterales bacterium HSG16]|nr:DEAD/DEAH box helicase [Desulfobacterales bacterium HSG16]